MTPKQLAAQILANRLAMSREEIAEAAGEKLTERQLEKTAAQTATIAGRLLGKLERAAGGGVDLSGVRVRLEQLGG